MRKQKQTPPESLSTSTVMNTDSLPSQTVPDTQSLCKLIRTCEEITIAAFKKAYCKGDLSVLIKEGIPDPDDLRTAWNELIFDYSSRIRTDESSHVVELQKDIAILSIEIDYVAACVQVMRVKLVKDEPIDPEMIENLAEMGFEIRKDPSDKAAFAVELNRLMSLLKTKIFDRETAEEELLRLSKTNGGKQLTGDEIDKNVTMLSRFMGYRIDPGGTMMDEYCQMINLYNEQSRRAKPADGE